MLHILLEKHLSNECSFRFIYGKSDVKALINQPIVKPSMSNFVNVEGFWVPQGDMKIIEPDSVRHFVCMLYVLFDTLDGVNECILQS